MGQYFTTLYELLLQGGDVMPPLVGCAVGLWYALGTRWVLLWSGRGQDARTVVHQALQDKLQSDTVLATAARDAWAQIRGTPRRTRERVELILFAHRKELGRYATLITVIVMIAPLLGLLGTVSGMIETFDSLGTNTLVSRSGGGVAGGISEALFSTQLGLMVAIPGLIAGRLLDRKQAEIEVQLDRLADLFCTRQERA